MVRRKRRVNVNGRERKRNNFYCRPFCSKKKKTFAVLSLKIILIRGTTFFVIPSYLRISPYGKKSNAYFKHEY